MDANAICITTSNADTKHQISLEYGVLGMKLADMTCIYVMYLHIKKIGNRIFVHHRIVSRVKRVEFLSDRMS